MRGLKQGSSAAELATVFLDTLLVHDGSFGRCFRRGSGRRASARPPGVAADEIFPMPLMHVRLPPCGRARERARRRSLAVCWVNSMIIVANHMMGGQRGSQCTLAFSAAQARLHQRLLGAVRDFLRGSPGPGGEIAIRKLLRDDLGYMGQSRHAVALGTGAGVPAVACQARVADILKDFDPDLARQALEPQRVLLPRASRPKVLPRPFVKVDLTYPALVEKNRKSGLQRLVRPRHVAKHRGRIIYSGVFAVPKDEKETRGISALCPHPRARECADIAFVMTISRKRCNVMT